MVFKVVFHREIPLLASLAGCLPSYLGENLDTDLSGLDWSASCRSASSRLLLSDWGRGHCRTLHSKVKATVAYFAL